MTAACDFRTSETNVFARFALDPDAVLIPIDVQAGFDLAASSHPGMATQGMRLVEAWRATRRPLIHVRHDSIKPGSPFAPGRPGNALRAGFEPQGDEPLVTKTVNAAFIGTELDLRLRRLGVRQLVLFGLTADMCVSTTARVAANLGYRVVVVGDASASFALTGPMACAWTRPPCTAPTWRRCMPSSRPSSTPPRCSPRWRPPRPARHESGERGLHALPGPGGLAS